MSNSQQASWFRGKSTEVESGAWTWGPHLSGHYFCNQRQATNLSGLSFLCEGDASWRHASGADAYIPACVYARLLQSCPTLCDLMDCSPPGSSVHGIFHARILEWVAISFSRRLKARRQRLTCLLGVFTQAVAEEDWKSGP